MSPAPAVIAVDTAGPVVGAALVRDGAAPVAWSARAGRGADAVLVPALAELLAQAGPGLQGIAVTVGPGAFTGLRVGLAIASGLALARGLPLLPMGSLAARALLAPGAPVVLALLDARKRRFYGASFALDGPVPRPLQDAVDADLDSILAGLPAGAVATGEGAQVAAEALAAAGVPIAPDAADSPALVLARHAASGALAACDPAAVRLRYIRPPDAKVPTGLSLLSPS